MPEHETELTIVVTANIRERDVYTLNKYEKH